MYATKKDLGVVESKLTDKIDSVDSKLTNKIDSVERKLTERIDSVKSELKQEIKASNAELHQAIKDSYDKLGEKLAKHFYSKDEIDRKFDKVNNDAAKLQDTVHLFKVEFETFRTTDFKQVVEAVDGINQKLEVIEMEPQAMKLQKEVDEIRGRVIRLEKR